MHRHPLRTLVYTLHYIYVNFENCIVYVQFSQNLTLKISWNERAPLILLVVHLLQNLHSSIEISNRLPKNLGNAMATKVEENVVSTDDSFHNFLLFEQTLASKKKSLRFFRWKKFVKWKWWKIIRNNRQSKLFHRDSRIKISKRRKRRKSYLCICHRQFWRTFTKMFSPGLNRLEDTKFSNIPRKSWKTYSCSNCESGISCMGSPNKSEPKYLALKQNDWKVRNLQIQLL